VILVPAKASVRVALADDPDPHRPLRMVEGFDLSLFNRHVKAGFVRRPYQPRFALRSAPADLFSFDFSVAAAMEGRAQCDLSATGGTVTGLAQWMHIDLGGGASYENPPGSNLEGHWRAGYYPFAAPRMTSSGEIIAVGGWHDKDSIALWADV